VIDEDLSLVETPVFSCGAFLTTDRSQISAVYDQRLYFFWFRRVKGGWEIDDSQPSMIYPRRLNAA
jgi:hypothetical protein